MADRWNTRKIITDTPKPPLRLFVPGETSAPSTVTEHPAGFRVRTRGDTGGTVKHEYRCPVHGVFEAMVPRAEVPDAVVCQVRCPHFHADGYLVVEGYPSTNANICGRTSPWAGSSCSIGISSGMVRS